MSLVTQSLSILDLCLQSTRLEPVLNSVLNAMINQTSQSFKLASISQINVQKRSSEH